MKPFDIELAKAKHPVQTINGMPVRIICFDRFDEDNDFPIVALCKNLHGEQIQKYTNEGHFRKDGLSHPLDLIMAPVKKTGYVNVYRTEGKISVKYSPIYESEKEAFDFRDLQNYIDTAKIEWEE